MGNEYKKDDLPKIGTMATHEMPSDLKAAMRKMTQLQINYAYFRARGFSQVESLRKAGSESKSRGNLTKMAYNMEKNENIKYLINYLQLQSAVKQFVDEDELISMTRNVFNEAFNEGKYAAANKSIEILAKMAGLLDGNKNPREEITPQKTKNKIDSFKDDIDSEEDSKEKMRRLKRILGDIGEKKTQ